MKHPYAGATTGLLVKGVLALLNDESFSLKTEPAVAACMAAEQVLAWIPEHQDDVSQFESKLVKVCPHVWK